MGTTHLVASRWSLGLHLNATPIQTLRSLDSLEFLQKKVEVRAKEDFPFQILRFGKHLKRLRIQIVKTSNLNDRDYLVTFDLHVDTDGKRQVSETVKMSWNDFDIQRICTNMLSRARGHYRVPS